MNPKQIMINFASIILLSIFIAMPCSASLKPFKSDGCSLFPDGTLKQKTLWQQCCVTHDLAYWKGGSVAERKMADRFLQQCVANIGASKTSKLMYKGVRIGGASFFPTPFRWGFGWPYLRGNRELTELELKEVKERLKEYKMIKPPQPMP